jgi:Trm5-related predicted tRNA methylase
VKIYEFLLKMLSPETREEAIIRLHQNGLSGRKIHTIT